MKIYLAGPMRGLPDDNRPAFDEAAESLRRLGHLVFSPVDHERAIGQPVGITDGRELRTQILWDLERIAESDLVVLLPGWIGSAGVRLELEMARFVGCPTFSLAEVLCT